MKLYDELAAWWPLLSRPEDYAEEAAIYRDSIERLSRRPVRTLLELGCGGGNNATHLRRHYTLTLTDLSPRMLAVSQRQNPGVEHHVGDMRTLRLGRRFDAVLVHDAIAYMQTLDDLGLAMRTARDHLEPGGVALFVPDDTLETFEPETLHGGHDGEGRALRYLEWDLPATRSPVHTVFVVALLDASGLRIERDDHFTGLFARADWLEQIRSAGLEPAALPYEHSAFDAQHAHEIFAGVLHAGAGR